MQPTDEIPSVLRAIANDLRAELRQDSRFFGPCGAMVGLLMLWRDRLRPMAFWRGDTWPHALFSDFVAFNAFSFIFLGLMMFGTMAGVARRAGRPLPRLDSMVVHIESRLRQLASSIIAFTAGLSVIALLHGVLALSGGGLMLVLAVLLLDAMLVVGFLSAVLIARRVAPFDTWWAAVVLFVAAFGSVVYLLVYGPG